MCGRIEAAATCFVGRQCFESRGESKGLENRSAQSKSPRALYFGRGDVAHITAVRRSLTWLNFSAAGENTGKCYSAESEKFMLLLRIITGTIGPTGCLDRHCRLGRTGEPAGNVCSAELGWHERMPTMSTWLARYTRDGRLKSVQEQVRYSRLPEVIQGLGRDSAQYQAEAFPL